MNANTIYHGDCLDVMRTFPSESVDLIATDPPFNTGRDFIGANGGFSDKWTDYTPEPLTGVQKDVVELAARTHSEGLSNFLCFMAVRIQEMYRVLKDTGSMYLHCDHNANSYLRLLMDAIFGRKQFRNELVWCYGGRGMSKTRFQNKHDTILYYTKSKNGYFNTEGASRPIAPEHVGRYNKVDSEGRRYGRFKNNRDGSYYNTYLKEGVVMEDWWVIPFVRGNESRKHWPTQKPLKLYQRIIKASSNEGDIVLDPFCGSGTTCLAAAEINRQWVGIDVSEEANKLSRNGLFSPFDMFTDSP